MSQPVVYTTSGNTSLNGVGNVFTATTSTQFLPGGSIHATCHQHIADANTIEYQDGLVIAYCKNCEARIQIERLPGGVNKAKLTTILTNLKVLDPELQEIIFASIIELEAQIEDEIDELRAALSLLQVAKGEACKQLLP
jgi:hypothetical protein